MPFNRREFLVSCLAVCASLYVKPLESFALTSTAHWVVRNKPMLGTFIEIAIKWPDRNAAFEIIENCYSYIEAEAQKISNWDSTSIVSTLNRGKPLETGSLPNIVKKLLEQQTLLQKKTDGLFCPKIGALTTLWRAAKSASSIPGKLELKQALKKVNQTVITSSSGFVQVQGQSGIDVGGIGKGLLADLAIDFLHTRSIKEARVAASGDLRFLGHNSSEVSIEHPRKDSYLTTLKVPPNFAISTSGDYRNNWKVNGKNYHHLIDPRTGLPGIENMQVSVIAPTAVQADALASALFFTNPDEASKLVKNFANVFVLGVGQSGELWGALGAAASNQRPLGL